MTDINQVFRMLSWDSDEETQAAGIREAENVEYLSVLFQPIESKSVWENCAKVIAGKPDDVLQHYTFRMFEWLQDMNWPGAQIIFDRLLKMPADMISHAFQHSLKQAQALADEPWLLCLSAFRKAYEGGTRSLT